MNLRERILALLSERPMSVNQIRKAVGLKKSEADLKTLSRELTSMSRDRLIRSHTGGGWKIAEAADSQPVRPRTKSTIELHEEATAQPTPKRGGGPGRLGEATMAILGALTDGPKTRTQLVALLPPEYEASLDNRLWVLKGGGHIVRTGRATYTLPGATVADALDIRVTPDRPVDVDGAVTINGSAMPTMPALLAAIHKEPAWAIDDKRPLADLRAKLMHSIDLVHAGSLSLDQVRAVMRLADGVAAIDGFACAE